MTRTIIHIPDITGQVTVTTGQATGTTDIIARTTGTGTMAITMGTAGGINGRGALPRDRRCMSGHREQSSRLSLRAERLPYASF